MGQKVKVIGIGDDGKNSLFPKMLDWIDEADVLVGGERHLAFFFDHPGEKWLLKGGMSSVIGRIAAEKEERRIVVLASGDPLFYGIAGWIVRKLGKEHVEVYPHLSSIQLAFARMGESWENARVESVHGRPLFSLVQRIDGWDKIALLTDEINTPGAIARYLLKFRMTEYAAFVAENLGSEEERCGFWDLSEIAEADFSPLNVVILKRKAGSARSRWTPGVEDDAFIQRKPERGLITKKEVRLLSLMELKLKPNGVMWDIGAGSGSVAIEAAKWMPDGQVYAIEKNEADVKNIEANCIRFRADVGIIHAKAPAGLETLPDPDSIFIGGSGGELREMLRVCCSRLKEGGNIVVNAATIETLSQAVAGLREEGMDVRVTLVSVARSKPILGMTRFAALNPVYVITAQKKSGEKGESE